MGLSVEVWCVAGGGFAHEAGDCSEGKREVETAGEAEEGSVGEDEADAKLSGGGWRGRGNGVR